MKPVKPLPKDQRVGKKERVVSTNIPQGFDQISGKCFVPWEDYMSLKRRYHALFKRYCRSKNNVK